MVGWARVRVSSFQRGRGREKPARKLPASGPASHGAEGSDSSGPDFLLCKLAHRIWNRWRRWGRLEKRGKGFRSKLCSTKIVAG
jgi:hypothetical protein